MNLLFQTQRFQLLLFCMNNQEFVTILDYFILLFFHKVFFSHFFYRFIILLNPCLFHMQIILWNQLIAFFYHNLNLKQSCWFFIMPLLLNFCCVFNIDLLFFRNSLWFFYYYLCQFYFSRWFVLFSSWVTPNHFLLFSNFTFLFMTHFLCLLLSYLDQYHLLSNYQLLFFIREFCHDFPPISSFINPIAFLMFSFFIGLSNS